MKRVKFIFSNLWKARQNRDRTAKKSEKGKRKEKEKWRMEEWMEK